MHLWYPFIILRSSSMKSINSQAQSGPEAFSLLLLSHFYAWFLNQHHQLINHHHLSNATFGEGKTNFKVFVKFFENHSKSLKKKVNNIFKIVSPKKSEIFQWNETFWKIFKYCVVQKYMLETPCKSAGWFLFYAFLLLCWSWCPFGNANIAAD